MSSKCFTETRKSARSKSAKSSSVKRATQRSVSARASPLHTFGPDTGSVRISATKDTSFAISVAAARHYRLGHPTREATLGSVDGTALRLPESSGCGNLAIHQPPSRLASRAVPGTLLDVLG